MKKYSFRIIAFIVLLASISSCYPGAYSRRHWARHYHRPQPHHGGGYW